MTVDRATSDRVGPQRSVAHLGATQRAKVFIYANDPISQAGVASQVRPRPEVQIVDAEELVLGSGDVTFEIHRSPGPQPRSARRPVRAA